MPLTPKEIEQMTFTASFRGYAEDEVDVFLEEVIISVSEYQQMIRDRDAKLASRGDGAPATPQDVQGANEEANRILQAAKRQAEQIVADARARALEIESNVVTVGAVLTPEQEAERERLLAGYARLRSELSIVKTRVQKALSASQEAFAVMEGKVGSIIDAAAPAEAVPTPAPEPVAETPTSGAMPASEGQVMEPEPQPESEAMAAMPTGASDDSRTAEVPAEGVEDEGERPRRPWER